jgi:hypothetical protein
MSAMSPHSRRFGRSCTLRHTTILVGLLLLFGHPLLVPTGTALSGQKRLQADSMRLATPDAAPESSTAVWRDVETPQDCATATEFAIPVIDTNPNDNLTWGVPGNPFGNYVGTYAGFHPAEDWNLVGGNGSDDLGLPVYPIADGVVVKKSSLGTRGYLVAVRHTGTFTIPARSGSSNNQTYTYQSEQVSSITSVYVHINNIPSNITEGACVQKGTTVLGKIMDPGGGPHLHLEVRHPNAVPSSNWSLVGPTSNWATVSGQYTGYYKNLQGMVDAGLRHPRDFIQANSLTTPYQGNVDIVSCNTVSGWAWNNTQPNTPASVGIYDGATLLTTASANQFRQDLLNAGIGNGFHAFSVPTPASLRDGQSHSVWIKILGPAHNLSNSPKSLTCGNVGNLDVADCNVIRGWAANTGQPNTSVHVNIYDGNTLLATVFANELRSDVGSILGDNGLHGFSFATPQSLKDGQTHSISVRFAGTSTHLAGSPRSITCGSQPVYGGYVDGATCNAIFGWAWNQSQPNTSINVDIYADGVYLTTVLANQFRQDLLNAGIGNGQHGFNIPTPQSLKDGQTHSISVRFAGTSTHLAGSPRSITCSSQPIYGGYHDGATCSTIFGWAWNQSQPNTSINVDIYADGVYLTTVLANQFRQDLLNAGIGNGQHAFTISTPASLRDGQTHSILVRFAGTTTSLTNSPRSLACSTSTPIVWNFNSSGNREGWNAFNISAASVQSGIFFIDPAGVDPYIQSGPISISASTYRYVQFSMANNALDSFGNVYFITQADQTWNSAKQVPFNSMNCSPSNCGGNAPFRYFSIDMRQDSDWAGTIIGIRIDPANNGQANTSADTVGWDYIRLSATQ